MPDGDFNDVERIVGGGPPPPGGDGSGYPEPPYGMWDYTDPGGDKMVWDVNRNNGMGGYVKVPRTQSDTVPLPSGWPSMWGGQEGEYRYNPYTGGYTKTGPGSTNQTWVTGPDGKLMSLEEAQWRANLDYQRQQYLMQQQQMQYEEQYRASQIELQKQQMAQAKAQEEARLEAERQSRLAALKARPASWLEYAIAAKETPAIQPWMKPLMSGQYEKEAVGAAMPNWNKENPEPKNLPELLRPAAQFMGRISDSAKQQYAGYEQARTGATPEDTQFRQWSVAPPSGRNTGLFYTR